MYEENFRVYGARKVWRQLGREEVTRGPLHGRAADARARSAGRRARAEVPDHDQRRWR